MTIVDLIARNSFGWTVGVFVVEGLIWIGISGDFPVRKDHRWNQLRLRLRGYAKLTAVSGGQGGLSDFGYLSKDPHEILLGTLKKVEQKNAVLVTIIVFALSVMAGSLLAPGDYTKYDYVITVFVASLIPPLFFSFQGIRQLDQRNFRHLQVKASEEIAAKLLQDALVSDLM